MKQYQKLLSYDGVALAFDKGALEAVADKAKIRGEVSYIPKKVVKPKKETPVDPEAEDEDDEEEDEDTQANKKTENKTNKTKPHHQEDEDDD